MDEFLEYSPQKFDKAMSFKYSPLFYSENVSESHVDSIADVNSSAHYYITSHLQITPPPDFAPITSHHASVMFYAPREMRKILDKISEIKYHSIDMPRGNLAAFVVWCAQLHTKDDSSAKTNTIVKTGAANNKLAGDEPFARVNVSNVKILKGPGDIEKDKVSKTLMPSEINECSLLSRQNGDPCSDDSVVQAIGNIIGAKPKTPAKDIVHMAKGVTQCPDERCVLHRLKPKIGYEVVQEQIDKNFKIEGPTDVTFLNNFDIDKTLEQWRIKFPKFYHCNFSMVDWEGSNDQLDREDVGKILKSGQFDTFGCVINTDVYSGRGKHWMALFVDNRPKKDGKSGPATIEYFNSAGNAPQHGFTNWMVRTKKQLENVGIQAEIIRVSPRRHQESQTECGVYSLWYIWCRLNGIPWEYFRNSNIADKWMMELRHHLFIDDRRPVQWGTQFKYGNYSKEVNVKWEP